MKKRLLFVLAIILCVFTLASCGIEKFEGIEDNISYEGGGMEYRTYDYNHYLDFLEKFDGERYEILEHAKIAFPGIKTYYYVKYNEKSDEPVEIDKSNIIECGDGTGYFETYDYDEYKAFLDTLDTTIYGIKDYGKAQYPFVKDFYYVNFYKISENSSITTTEYHSHTWDVKKVEGEIISFCTECGKISEQ